MRSMTGFGQVAVQANGRRITIEIRAVNQRFLDVRLSMPREYLPWEKDLRAIVQSAVGRGKVEVSVNRGNWAAGAITVEINEVLARAYVDGMRRLQSELGLAGEVDVAMVLGRPDVLRVVEDRGDPAVEIAAVRNGLTRAIRRFNADREREGRSLARDLKERVKRLRQIEHKMRTRAARIRPVLARRMRERMESLVGGQPIKEERLLQEVAVLVERADVTEELVRLDSHLQAMSAAIHAGGPTGRQLDFLLQEVHREVNTIASKSADLGMTNLSIAARGETEKIREQVQNVE